MELMKKRAPELAHLTKHLLSDVAGAYDTIADNVENVESIYSTRDERAMLCALWKLQLILDARISGADTRLFHLGSDSEYWSTFCDLPEYVSYVREICLEKLGFTSEEYTFAEDEPDEILYGLFHMGEPEEFVNHMADGDVFEADTVYLMGLADFIYETEMCSYFSYLSVSLFKNSYLGNLIERAEALCMVQETSYVSMKEQLQLAFGRNCPWDGQCGYGVTAGIFYAYLAFYDTSDGDENFTWTDVPPGMIWHVACALCHARDLEEAIGKRERQIA